MKKLSKVGIILSFILTTCFLFGYSIKKFHVIDSLFYKKNIIKTFFAFIILLVLIYILLIIIFKLLDKISNNKEKGNKLYNFIFEKNPLLITFIIFFLFSIVIL